MYILFDVAKSCDGVNSDNHERQHPARKTPSRVSILRTGEYAVSILSFSISRHSSLFLSAIDYPASSPKALVDRMGCWKVEGCRGVPAKTSSSHSRSPEGGRC
jgi:hypothetical protein